MIYVEYQDTKDDSNTCYTEIKATASISTVIDSIFAILSAAGYSKKDLVNYIVESQKATNDPI